MTVSPFSLGQTNGDSFLYKGRTDLYDNPIVMHLIKIKLARAFYFLILRQTASLLVNIGNNEHQRMGSKILGESFSAEMLLVNWLSAKALEKQKQEDHSESKARLDSIVSSRPTWELTGSLESDGLPWKGINL